VPVTFQIVRWVKHSLPSSLALPAGQRAKTVQPPRNRRDGTPLALQSVTTERDRGKV
jgi:hypothetical protein